MVSLDPDDFLADLADVPDHPSRPFPEKVAEEEELEWLSNKDSFPALETCMLPEELPRQQMAIPNAEQGNRALLMPPMPGRKTKEDSCKAKSMKVCTFCGVSQTSKGPEDASGACNACGFSYKKSIKGEKVKNCESDKEQDIKKKCTFCGVYEDASGACNACGFSNKKSIKGENVKNCESDKEQDIKKKCTHCEITKTPMWRAGPDGPNTLCNACGVRYRSGRLCPEYRPANSPTFSREMHSNMHKKVMKMRKQIHGIEGTVEKPVNTCTNSAATTALKKMKNDTVPTASTVNILEQPRRGVIADQQSPVTVQNNTKGSSILEPHLFPSTFLGQQQLFCDQLNNKLNPEDTAKVEFGRKTTILMSSRGTVKVSYKVPNKNLEKQLISSCGNLEPAHQLPIEFLEQHQLFDDQPNHNCNKKHTTKAEMTMKPVDVSTNLMKSNNDSLPAVETLNVMDHSRGHYIAEQRSPVLEHQNSTNSSATLMSCCETDELPHQSPSEIFSRQLLVHNPDNNKSNKKDSAKVEIEGNSSSTMSSCGIATLPRQAPNEIPGQQDLFFNQHNNNCNKEDTAIVGTEVKCLNCGAQQSPQQWEAPLGPTTLCLSCRLAMHTARRKRSTSLASNKRRKKEDSAKAEMAGKPGDKCTNSFAALKDSKKDSCVNTSNISEQPDVVVISEKQTPAFVFGNSTMKKCTHCEITQTPQWREGPHGPRTLCNACGVRYKSGRLCPEYRPANSPTFSWELHSNCHRKIMEMRKQIYGIEGEVAKHVDKRTATMALENMKKDMSPIVTTVNILEQRKSVIAEQQNPVSVLENNINSSTTLEPPHPPSKLLRQQQLVCNQLNNKNNQEDTAKVEVERNTNILMSSRGTIKLSEKVPTTVLEKQHLFNFQPTNKRRKKNTVNLKNDGNNATLMSFCGNIEPPHQMPSEFLEQHQHFYDQPNNNCNKKHTATDEMTMIPVDMCGALMKSKKDSFPAAEAMNILDHSRGMFINEQRSPVLVLQNSTNSSATPMSSCETVELSHQSPSKIFRQQLLFPNPGNNLPNEKDTTLVEIEGNNTSTSSCGILTLPHQAPNEFLGQQQLLFEQFNYNCNKKDTATMGIEVKCHNCGAEKKLQQLEGPLTLKTLCLTCGRANHTARQKRSVSLAFNKRRKKEDIAKVERAVIPSDIANAEHQKHFSVLENNTNDSIDLLSSCRITIPHRTRSKGLCRRRSIIPGQQVGIGEKCVQCGKQTNRWRMGPLGPTTLCNTCGNKYPPLWGISKVTVDVAKCQHCGSEEPTRWLMCPLGNQILCAACYYWIMYGQQQFCNQTNNNPDRKASSEVVIGNKCYHCGIIAGPMGSETLCNVCRFKWYKFGDLW